MKLPMKFKIIEKTIHKIAILLLFVSGVLSLTAAMVSNIREASYTEPKSCSTFHISTINPAFGENNQCYELCSSFTASSGRIALFGGNADARPKDHSGTSSRIFLFPSTAERYGFIALGWDYEKDRIHYLTLQDGMNEKGLAFARNGLPKFPLNPHPEKPFSGFSLIFLQKVMGECSNVACVIELTQNADWGSDDGMEQQLLFADSMGDAVIISAGKDGELAFTRKNEGERFLVATNFNRAVPENGSYPCWRYDTAVAMLEKIEHEDDITVGYFETILDAIHVEGTSVNTVYSFIFDLNTGDIYVYYFHQFEESIKLNLSKELVNVQSDLVICTSDDLTSLFSQETKDRAKSEFYEYQKQFVITMVLTVIPIVAGFLGFYLFVYRKREKESSQEKLGPN